LDDYLAKGGSKYADVIGFHFYVSPQPPETMLSIMANVKLIMAKHGVGDKPLWNTETGWFISNRMTKVIQEPSGFKSKVLSEADASGYIARAYLLSWASGVDRFYWYSWDGEGVGLTEADGKTVKPPAYAYAEVYDWLVGARMIECTSDAANMWKCSIRRNDGNDAWIVWNAQRVMSLEIPKYLGFNEVRDLEGDRRSLKAGDRIEAGPMPVLLWKNVK
jgi:hypothetical protein